MCSSPGPPPRSCGTGHSPHLPQPQYPHLKLGTIGHTHLPELPKGAALVCRRQHKAHARQGRCPAEGSQGMITACCRQLSLPGKSVPPL